MRSAGSSDFPERPSRAWRVRVRTEEAVLHLYNVSDVEVELAKKAQPKEVEISTEAK